jgi:predicted PurR-regulated permease PerM
LPWHRDFLFPFGHLAGSLHALDSLCRRWTGRIRWKGRIVTQHQRHLRLGDADRSTLVTIAIIVAIAIFFYLVRDILIPFVFAGIIAYVCTPLVDALAQRTRRPRWLFAMAVLVALLGLAALIGYLGAPPLAREVTRLVNDLQGTLENLTRQLIGDGQVKLLGESIDAATVAAYAVNGVRTWIGVSGGLATLVTLGFAGIIGFILSWVVLGYFLIGAPQLAEGLFWLVPPRSRPFVHRVWADLDPILRRYFIGVALVVLYSAVVAYIGLGPVLGLRHAAFLALFTGVLEVIPIIGPFGSAVLVGLVAVQQAHSSWNILAYIAYASVLRISIDEFVAPIVLGRAAYVRPVLVMFCFLAGAILFGVVGIVLAIPAALTVKATLAELYKDPEALTE